MLLTSMRNTLSRPLVTEQSKSGRLRHVNSSAHSPVIDVVSVSNSFFCTIEINYPSACLQYRGNIVVSGSSDNTIRIWDIEHGTCLRTLEGHEELVRCIRFDDKRIVSGAYDGNSYFNFMLPYLYEISLLKFQEK